MGKQNDKEKEIERVKEDDKRDRVDKNNLITSNQYKSIEKSSRDSYKYYERGGYIDDERVKDNNDKQIEMSKDRNSKKDLYYHYGIRERISGISQNFYERGGNTDIKESKDNEKEKEMDQNKNIKKETEIEKTAEPRNTSS